MKIIRSILQVFVAAFVFTTALHAEKVLAGPKGGRLLQLESAKAEFLVMPDRKVEVTFYDASDKPVASGDHVVALIAEVGAKRTKLEMAKTPTGFVSSQPLPAGDPYRVVVQIRPRPDAPPRNFRVDLVLTHCGGCNRAEYACTCEDH